MRCLASCKGGALRLSLRGRVGEGEAKRAAQGGGAHPPVVRLLGSAPWKRGRAVGFSHSRCLSLLPSHSHPKPQTTRKRAPCSTFTDTLLPCIHIQIYPPFLPHHSMHLLRIPSSPVFPHLSFPSHFWRAGGGGLCFVQCCTPGQCFLPYSRCLAHAQSTYPFTHSPCACCSFSLSIRFPSYICLLFG